MAKRPKKTGDDATVLAPELRLAGALLSGATVPAHVCTKVPKTAEQVREFSIGGGLFNRKGGQFEIVTPGRAVCLAVVWEGEVVTTVPDAMPVDVEAGQKCKCGALDLRSTQ